LNIVSPTGKTSKEYLIQYILPLLQQTSIEFRQFV